MDDLIRDLDALLARFEAELQPLADAELERRPSDGGWNAREALAHVETTLRLYLEKIEAALERHPERRSAHAGPPAPGLFGGILLRTLRKPGKTIRAPRAFRPPGEATQGTVQELIAIHRRLRAAAEAIDARNLGALRIGTPISPLLRLSLRAAVEVQIVHGTRHLEQALAAARG